MPGRVKQLIDELCSLRACGSPGVIHFVHANLMLHGVNPQSYHENSPDDEETERVVRRMIAGFKRGKGHFDR